MGLDLGQCKEVYEALLAILDRNGFGHLSDRVRDAHSRPALAEEYSPPASAPPAGRRDRGRAVHTARTASAKEGAAGSVFAAPSPDARQKLRDIIEAILAATSGAVALAAVVTGSERGDPGATTQISFVEPIEGHEVQRVDREVVMRWKQLSEGWEGALGELSARIDAQ